jgi:predicted  nucleic acid-binding Zn-ribbon protein
MRDQLQRRLDELKKEFATGQARAADLEKQQTMVHQTLLRISGAIQVLEEELKMQPQNASNNNETHHSDTTQSELNRTNGSIDHVVA